MQELFFILSDLTTTLITIELALTWGGGNMLFFYNYSNL